MARYLTITCDEPGCAERMTIEHIHNMAAFGPMWEQMKEAGWIMRYRKVPYTNRYGAGTFSMQTHWCPQHKPKRGQNV